MQPTAIEFYCGIGGFAAAVTGCRMPPGIAAYDIDLGALSVYRTNFPAHSARAVEIRCLDEPAIAADFWWLSPPCLPFTRKGKQRDLDDPRCESLIRLIGRVRPDLDWPAGLVIENVPPFAKSRAGQWIVEHLQRCGFDIDWQLRCPSELGWPMRRRRSYLLASRTGWQPLAAQPADRRPLRQFYDPSHDDVPPLRVPVRWLTDYARAVDLVDPRDETAQASCFTSSYGRMPVRSGSYLLVRPGQTRFFAPEEILRLLGFPQSFVLPSDLSMRRRWALVGNSLSLPVVRWLLTRFPWAATPIQGRRIGD